MKPALPIAVAGLLALGACGDVGAPLGGGNSTATAERGCMIQLAGRAEGTARVIRSDFSQQGSIILIQTADGGTWRCVASNEGLVADLTRIS